MARLRWLEHAATFVLGGAACVVTAALLSRRRSHSGGKLLGLTPPASPGQPCSSDCDHDKEPDEEPESEHEIHREFVRVLRVLQAQEPGKHDHDYWKLSDIQAGSDKEFAIKELKKYHEEFKTVKHDPFWQRKSKKVVIAVVVVRMDEEGTFAAFRGMNTEVSLPSGSLCAERAGIASAASNWKSAHEIVCVAVLDPADTINPLWPCEVCQSWLAKLRDENEHISILAFKNPACDEFVVRINGTLQPPPRVAATPGQELMDKIRLPEDEEEFPWEAQRLVYVDGSFDVIDAEHHDLLHAAAQGGSHVLVGLHSDSTLEKESGRKPTQEHASRLLALLENRHVKSVLVDAPWRVTQELIAALGIRSVFTLAKGAQSCCKDDSTPGAYDAARKLGILRVAERHRHS